MYRVDGRQRSDSFADLKSAQQYQRLVERVGGEAARSIRLARDAAGAGADVLTVADWLEHHLSHATGVTDGTVAEYRRLAARTWLPSLGPLPLDALTREHVARWIGWQAEQVTRRGTKTAAKTIANAHGLLSTVIGSAVEAGRVPRNPCYGVPLPSSERREMVFLSHAEFALLLGCIPAEHVPLVVTLAGTGIRWGEATALRWGDLDLDASTPVLRISRAWKRAANGGRVLGAPKTAKSLRTVSLPPQVAETLRPLAGPADQLVFRARRGGQLHHQVWHPRVWVPAVERANDPERETRLGKSPRVHDLRHSHASWLIAAGVPLPVIQARLGHESIQTTVDVYGHLAPDALAIGAAAAGAALVQAVPEIEG